jgi:mannose-6-phosphate isomerase-like protein (cupin superfamily)
VILSGEGIVEIDDLPGALVEANDIVFIPSMCRQRIRNIGQQDLIFLAICSPRFTKACYEDMESNSSKSVACVDTFKKTTQ